MSLDSDALRIPATAYAQTLAASLSDKPSTTMIDLILCRAHCDNGQFDWSILTPIIAVIVSIAALLFNRAIAQRTRRLSILQSILKTALDKAKDCNNMWEDEVKGDNDPNSPHLKVMSELTISREIIEKSITLFKADYKSITKHYDDFYYIFWKQLRTDLRGWIRRTPDIASQRKDEYYTEQVIDFQSKFKKHFEPVK